MAESGSFAWYLRSLRDIDFEYAWGGMGIIHAFLSVVGGIFITYGYQKGETSFVSIFEYTFLFFATSWGVIFFTDYISKYIIFGMLLILLSGILVSFKEKYLIKPK